MALINGFEVQSNRALFSTGGAHSANVAGWSYASDGRLRANTAGTKASSPGGGGSSQDSTAALLITTIAGGALPAGCTKVDGLAYDSAGRLVVDTVTAAQCWAAGVPMTHAGAVVGTVSA